MTLTCSFDSLYTLYFDVFRTLFVDQFCQSERFEIDVLGD